MRFAIAALVALGASACTTTSRAPATEATTARTAVPAEPSPTTVQAVRPFTTDELEVIRTVQQTFQAMAAKDTTAFAAIMHQSARLITTGESNGQPVMRVTPIDQFIRSIGSSTSALREDIGRPEVRISDNLATVWAPYVFYLDGQFHHCGVDSFQLARTTAGWRIVHIVDTHRRDDCPTMTPWEGLPAAP